MKSKVYRILLVFLMSMLLSACSTTKPNSAMSSGASGSNQAANTSTSSSAGSTSSAEGEDARSTDAYKAVLQNKASFVSTEDAHEFLLSDFLKRNSEYEGIYKVTRFTVLDMDEDQTPEVILELSLNEYPEQYEILHDSDGTVYGYNEVYRGFETPKIDGTYTYSNGASDVGVQKILRFNSDSVETETVGYSQSDYSDGNTEISYFIHNASVTKEAFDAFLDQQNKKKDVQWYEFSAENIAAEVGMDWNAD